MASARRLTSADIEIWLKVARTVVARAGSVLPEPLAALPEPVLMPKGVTPRPAGRQSPAVRQYPMPSYAPPVSVPKPPPVGLERRYKRRVADGRIPVEAVLDLHGMTQAQAHVALHRFLVGAQRRGLRLVVVVTGKGLKERSRSDMAEPGVLRRAVPFWLRDGALRPIVVGFEQAALTHGGEGALYVRLRRPSGAE